ncbi:MAG: sortase [Chloroflexota bacterium]|nr:sortase [Chloroflexota bacterium]
MSPKLTRYLTHLLTLLGLSMMFLGGIMWWRQSRLEAALLSQEERVLLAVTAEVVTPTPLLKTSEQDAIAANTALPVPSLTPSPPYTAEPRITPTPTVAATETPPPTPTPDPFPPASTIPSRIVAPSIGMDATVVEMGWEVKTDAQGNPYSEWVVPTFAAGWHKNSTLPGHGGNTVLSGHHNIDGEVFRYVVNLEPGHEIQLTAGDMTYRYAVEEKYIVKEKGEPIEVRRENNKFVQPTDDERLTLVTCWPYETNTHRVVVIARPIIEPAVPADAPALDSAEPVADSTN